MIPRAGISSTGVLKNVAYGSLVAPTSAQAGFRLDANGAIVSVAAGSAVAPFSYNSGFMFDANGALVTIDSGSKTAPISYSAGVPLDANGYAVTTTGAVFSVQDGLGYDVNGNLCALVSGGGASTAFSDNFNRADAASLGAPWAVLSGAADWAILSNQASATGFDMSGRTYAADGSIQADFVATGTPGIFIRATDSNNYVLVNYDGTTVKLSKCVAGGFTTLGTFAATGVPHTVKIVFVGPSLTVFVDGTSRITASDAFNSSATLIGLNAFTGGTGIDNVVGT